MRVGSIVAGTNMYCTGVAKLGANEIQDMVQEETKIGGSTLMELEPEFLVAARWLLGGKRRSLI